MSDLTFKFGEKKNEEKNEILILLRKLQNENMNKEKSMNEMKSSILEVKKSVDAIIDLNLNLEMEVKSLRDKIEHKEPTEVNNHAMSLQILIAALNSIASQPREVIQPSGRMTGSASQPSEHTQPPGNMTGSSS